MLCIPNVVESCQPLTMQHNTYFGDSPSLPPDCFYIQDNSSEPDNRTRRQTWPKQELQAYRNPTRNIQAASGTLLERSLSHCSDNEATSVEYLHPTYEPAQLLQNVDLAPVMFPRKKTRNPWGNASYADLITKAILSSPQQRLTLAELYEWFAKNIPYFADKLESKCSAGWKNSVRHNLSLHDRFIRVPNEDQQKSSWWMIDPDMMARVQHKDWGSPGARRRSNSSGPDRHSYYTPLSRAQQPYSVSPQSFLSLRLSPHHEAAQAVSLQDGCYLQRPGAFASSYAVQQQHNITPTTVDWSQKPGTSSMFPLQPQQVTTMQQSPGVSLMPPKLNVQQQRSWHGDCNQHPQPGPVSDINRSRSWELDGGSMNDGLSSQHTSYHRPSGCRSRPFQLHAEEGSQQQLEMDFKDLISLISRTTEQSEPSTSI